MKNYLRAHYRVALWLWKKDRWMAAVFGSAVIAVFLLTIFVVVETHIPVWAILSLLVAVGGCHFLTFLLIRKDLEKDIL